MLKVIHIPLDERPCNYDFPHQIFCGNEFDIKRVPFEYMGLKKKPGQIDKINEYLLKQQNETSGEQFEQIEALRTIVWHFRQLQEKQNSESPKNKDSNTPANVTTYNGKSVGGVLLREQNESEENYNKRFEYFSKFCVCYYRTCILRRKHSRRGTLLLGCKD